MKYLDLPNDHISTLPPVGQGDAIAHLWSQDEIEAVNVALAAQRPLLVRGEPGSGKSQLARAAAFELGRAFLSFTVDARTEARDLLFTVDTVARLAEAQILGHLPGAGEKDVRALLAEANFTEPGPLWWVFDWTGAKKLPKVVVPSDSEPAGWQEKDSAVLLIDEIDKADPAVPNGLLEALGQGLFPAPGGVTVRALKATPPLVIITTNEERTLPDAFMRRCLVLQLDWPTEKLIETLIARGRAQFSTRVDDQAIVQAAHQVAASRPAFAERGLCAPGGAEFLDLLRVLANRFAHDPPQQLAALQRIARFALDKHLKET